ncbi:unnamed protein product [Tuber aestivum]|uniref:Ig-like domain-containing protein n=1 Tax=Tuber aestivum TaxID=59557 RepID=A0A292PLH6_9PEZI|nr:unnamed protein product [Tuber aestivum]
MHMHYFLDIVLFTTTLTTLTSAHGVIIEATGDAGGQGTALAVDAATPRDGTRRRPFQQDTTVFEEEDDDEGAVRTGCGMTLQAGEIDIPTAMQSVIAQNGGLPQVSPGGELTMTLHQVNADGAGPYQCMIDQTGTGESFTPMVVTQNVPGEEGRERDGSETAFMPANMECTGTAGAMAGICVPVQQAGADAAGGVGASASASASAGTGAAAGTATAASSTLANTEAPNTASAGNAAATNTAAAGNVNGNGNDNANNANVNGNANANNAGANNNVAGAGAGGNAPNGNNAGRNDAPGGPRGLGRQAAKRFRA